MRAGSGINEMLTAFGKVEGQVNYINFVLHNKLFPDTWVMFTRITSKKYIYLQECVNISSTTADA